MHKTNYIKLLAGLSIFSLISTISYGQVTQVVTVTASVAAGTSTLVASPTSVDFGSSALTAAVNDHRHSSGVVSLDYFAANAPWSIKVYTTRTDTLSGLVNSTDNAIPLKVNVGTGGTAPFDDPEVDTAWSGTEAQLKFFSVFDDGTVDTVNGGIFFTKLASSANENPAEDASFQFIFATDVAGAAAGAYTASVTIELAIE